jgi:hypothetical protein
VHVCVRDVREFEGVRVCFSVFVCLKVQVRARACLYLCVRVRVCCVCDYFQAP